MDFNRLQELFLRAGQQQQRGQAYFCLAGQLVRVRSTCPELLQQLTRPWSHLACGEGQVQLEIDLTLAEASHEPDSVCFALSEQGDYASQVLPRSRSAWRKHPAKIVAVYQPPALLTLYELGRPLHAAISLWSNSLASPVVHAGLVQIGGQGVLIGGDAGRGKTTTALSCLQEGHKFLGDDLCIVDSQLRGHSLYSTTFLRPERRASLAYLGQEEHLPRYSWEEKSLTYLHPIHVSRLQSATSICVVVLPHPEGTTWSRISVAEALRGLAPSSLLVGQLSAGQMGLERLTQLLRQCACFRLPWALPPARSLASIVQELAGSWLTG